MTLARLGSDLSELTKRTERMKKRRGKPLGHSFGFPDLDKPFGGLVPGEMTIIAARPGMGKTALAMSIARNLTREITTHGREGSLGVFVFALEMSREAVLTREALGDAGIDSERFRTGYATDAELAQFLAAAHEVTAEPLYVDDTAGATSEYMRAQVHELRGQGVSPVLIVIDHIGLVNDRGNGLYEKVTNASNAAKRLAKEAKCPVLVLAQLNRKVEERTPPYPQLADLRESGALEQDADNVLLLYRHDYYYPLGNASHDPSRAGIANVFIGKARNGTQNVNVKLRFNGPKTRFEAL